MVFLLLVDHEKFTGGCCIIYLKDAETYLVFRTLKKSIPEKLNLRPLYGLIKFKVQGSTFKVKFSML